MPHANAYAQRSRRHLQHLGVWQRQTHRFATPLLCDTGTGCQLKGKDVLGTLGSIQKILLRFQVAAA